MEKLLQGIEQFRDRVYPKYRVAFKNLEHGQNPLALFITCADSRIDPSLLMQTDPGDLFICRNAGNLVPPYTEDGAVEATVEYAVDGLKIRDIVVCGHSDCGAMKAALNPAATERLPAMRRWLRHADRACRIVQDADHTEASEKLRCMTEENVIAQLDNLMTYPSVAAAEARGEMNLYGWIYDIPSGSVRMWSPSRGVFEPFNGTLPTLPPRRVRPREAAAA